MKNSLDRYVDKIFNKYYNYLKYNHVIFLLISFLYFLIFKNILDISDNNIYLKIFRYFLIIFYFSSLAPFVTTFNAFSKRGEIIRLLYCLFRYIYIYPVYVINSETPYDLYYSDFYYLFLMGIAVGGVLEYIFVSVYIKKYQVIEQLDNRRREFFLGGTMLIFCAIMPFFLSSIVDCNVKRGKGFELKNLHDTYFVRREYINNDGKRIILMPMSHVGQKEFYERLIENISPDEKLIFIDEGIRYNKKEQVKKITENINKIIKKKEDYVCQNDYFYTLIKDFNRVNGDVHVDDLHPILRKDYLNQELNEKEKEILKDLYITEKINKRDEIAVAKMKEIYDDYNVFIFPWGASHMIGIEKLISESGFVEEESRKFNVLFIRQEIIYLRIIKWLYDTIKT